MPDSRLQAPRKGKDKTETLGKIVAERALDDARSGRHPPPSASVVAMLWQVVVVGVVGVVSLRSVRWRRLDLGTNPPSFLSCTAAHELQHLGAFVWYESNFLAALISDFTTYALSLSISPSHPPPFVQATSTGSARSLATRAAR